ARRLRRGAVPVHVRQGVGVAPFIERDEAGEMGGGGRAAERFAQVAHGGGVVGALDLLASGGTLGGGGAVGVGQRPLIGAAVSAAERLRHLRTLLARRPGAPQMLARGVVLVERQVSLSEREVP